VFLLKSGVFFVGTLHAYRKRLSSEPREKINRRKDMPTISFSDAERQLLIELLDTEVRELVHEIHHTDDRDYRQVLKEKEGTIEELLKKLKAAS
jgi:hypothetical protein